MPPPNTAPSESPAHPTGSSSDPRDRPARRLDAGRRFRPDVEGLRSVAVVLVVLYHAGVPGITGGYVGVDVFFVLSGFLITGLLLDEVRRTGTVRLARFYGRRARRLLPLAAVVLVATAVAGWLVLPPLDRPTLGGDVIGAALYAANWHYALEATDYLGADSGESLLLHFWSLGVEEQFYVVWPLLLLAVALGGRGGWAATRRRVVLGLVALGAGSLVLSAWLTPTTGSWAYFGLHTRAWELAAGAAVAVSLPLLARLPRVAAGAAGWVGLLAVVGSALVYDDATVFPGTAALAPVLGTALVVAAGVPEGARGTATLFSAPALRYVGRISYAWYLWHWPCLLVARALADGSPSPGQTAVAVLASLVLAAVSNVVVEDPVRHARWLAERSRRSLGLGAALTAVSVAAGLVLLQPWTSTASTEDLAGLQQTVAGPDGTTGPEVPSVTPAQARDDRYKPGGCWADYEGTTPPPLEECTFGDPDGTVQVALLGDSHAGNWLRALDALGQARGWTVHTYVKSACPPFDVPVFASRLDRRYSECTEWNAAVHERLDEIGPGLDLVLLGRAGGDASVVLDEDDELVDVADVEPRWQAGVEKTLTALTAGGARVAVLRDTPRSPQDVPACLSEVAPEDWRSCSFPVGPATGADEPLAAAEVAAAEAVGTPLAFLDLTARLCPGGTCPVVAANGAVVYLDTDHFTDSFSRSAAPLLAAQMDEARVTPGEAG